MRHHQTHFRNVDLDLDSTTDLRGLVLALGGAVMPMYSSRTGHRHAIRLQLSSQTKSPAQAISRFAKAVNGLTRKHRQLWNRIRVKEFDIGIQGGDEPHAMEWVLDPATLKVAVTLGARIRITVYSPRPID